jgi:hypothetical protein
LVARGGFEALLGAGLDSHVELAIAQARAYDYAAHDCFPGFFASRRNYDVAQGIDARGRWRSGVLEQSWRLGGASSAEILALEAFHADPTLHLVRAASVEVHDLLDIPPRASLFYRGVDERVGPITKYAQVDRHDHAG